MDSYTLLELNRYIRRVVALNFQEPLWVEGEIAQCNTSKGHYFLDLIQKDPETEAILAWMPAIMWQRRALQIQRKLSTAFHLILKEGNAVRLKVQPEFDERYGLKLQLLDLDTEYSLGQLALEREKVIQQLARQGLFERNRALSLPPVIQRIAVLSSPDAAGYADFSRQLQQNELGYQFHTRLFRIAVQGQHVEKDLIQALKKINKRAKRFDAVVIIRGGGSRLDLAAFDSYSLCKAVAQCRLPVLTGIGHETDEAVADRVAHQALKTPTAVGAFLIQRNAGFEAGLLQSAQRIQQQALEQLDQNRGTLRDTAQQLSFQLRLFWEREEEQLRQVEKELRFSTSQLLRDQNAHLNHLEEQLQLLDPQTAFARGFSLSTVDGAIVYSVEALKKGQTLTTYFGDGHTASTIQKINRDEEEGPR